MGAVSFLQKCKGSGKLAKMHGLCHWRKKGRGCAIAGRYAGAVAGYQECNGNGGLEDMHGLCQADSIAGVVAGWQICRGCVILAVM